MLVLAAAAAVVAAVAEAMVAHQAAVAVRQGDMVEATAVHQAVAALVMAVAPPVEEATEVHLAAAEATVAHLVAEVRLPQSPP